MEYIFATENRKTLWWILNKPEILIATQCKQSVQFSSLRQIKSFAMEVGQNEARVQAILKLLKNV